MQGSWRHVSFKPGMWLESSWRFKTPRRDRLFQPLSWQPGYHIQKDGWPVGRDAQLPIEPNRT